jgi:hypothetical protein
MWRIAGTSIVSFVFLGVVIMTNPASPENLLKPVLELEVLLKTEREAVMQPFVMAQADDGGFIIAGSMSATKQGWAAKTDAKGAVLWNYFVDLRDEDKAAFARQLIVNAEFRGTAPLPDGSVYLCGSMPRPPGTYSPGLLTHLDAKGRVLSERLIFPEQKTERGVAHFYDCVRWEDGVAILGDIVGWVRDPEQSTEKGPRPNYKRLSLYWLLVLDAAGNVKWERQIPTNDGRSANPGEMGLMADGSSLVFSSYSGLNTEVVRVSASGEVQARKQLPNSGFKLVHSVVPDGIIQILRSFSSKGPVGLTAITLDERLEEVGRTQGQPTAYAARVAYRMPDHALVLFGSAVHSVGERYTSQIAYVDPTLQHEQRLDLPRNNISDGGSIWAAAPAQDVGHFVIATTAYAHGLDINHPERFGALPDFKRGAALNFVKLK